MLRKSDFPILEYDAVSAPIVTPDHYIEKVENWRKITRCVITYFSDIVELLERAQVINQVFRLRTEGYRPRIYEMKVGNEYVFVMAAPVGAPQAARIVECLAAMGVKKFMISGGAGTINDDVTRDYVLVPAAATRDEGTSYHYLPPSRDVQMNPRVLSSIEKTLTAEGVKFVKIKTWTTDAIFRETIDKVELRKAEGCSTVEMECSAFYSVAAHLGFLCGQLLYAGDKLTKEGWDYRDWHTRGDKRTMLFDLSVKCLMNL
ncbi:MAG: nucleoside phosphorylase [Firmicutes bacterium]|nr:nucleoside phosphorylase [Bacillota bacterium]